MAKTIPVEDPSDDLMNVSFVTAWNGSCSHVEVVLIGLHAIDASHDRAIISILEHC
jgi:hypothetical protein